jgi:hypothetical protein
MRVKRRKKNRRSPLGLLYLIGLLLLTVFIIQNLGG